MGKNPHIKKFTHCGGNGLRVPPVPIPNTEVKPQHADGTWLETARESRSLPHSNSRSALSWSGFFICWTSAALGAASALGVALMTRSLTAGALPCLRSLREGNVRGFAANVPLQRRGVSELYVNIAAVFQLPINICWSYFLQCRDRYG